MPGAVIIIIVMAIIGPIAVMLTGAVWSAVFGWLVGDDADVRAGEGASTGA
ncbi:MAG TPA: hypothetical protein VIC35_01560 [Acidimicrobiia bacterium]|jgi:hypothetical protein